MIPAHAAQAAIPLAEQLEAANRRVTAISDTPLAQLVSISGVQVAPVIEGTLIDAATGAVDIAAVASRSYEPDARAIEAESRIESVVDNSMSQHDVMMDTLITDMAQVVGQHLTFAKNTVRPLIKTFVDESAAALAAFPDQATFSPQVVKIDMPAVALMGGIESEAAKFASMTYLPMTTAANLAPQSAAVAISYLATGSAAVDNATAAWVAAVGEDFFAKVYNVVFAASATGVQLTPDQLFADKLEGQQALAAAFLMGRHLLDNIPEGAPYILNDYRVAVGTIVEQVGLRLSNAYADRGRNCQLENMVLGSNKDNVFVFAPVYDKWISEGGTLALLYGNLLLDRPNTSLPAMAEDQVKCLERWEQHNRFLTTTLQNRKHDSAKDTLRFCVDKVVAENLQAIFGEIIPEGEITLTTPQVADALQAAHNYINSLDQDQIKDLWSVGVQVIAGSIFSFSGAVQILRGIERATKDNEGIDANEAALLSLIDYVTNYVIDQVELRDL